jgi:hypothetical protein
LRIPTGSHEGDEGQEIKIHVLHSLHDFLSNAFLRMLRLSRHSVLTMAIALRRPEVDGYR